MFSTDIQTKEIWIFCEEPMGVGKLVDFFTVLRLPSPSWILQGTTICYDKWLFWLWLIIIGGGVTGSPRVGSGHNWSPSEVFSFEQRENGQNTQSHTLRIHHHSHHCAGQSSNYSAKKEEERKRMRPSQEVGQQIDLIHLATIPFGLYALVKSAAVATINNASSRRRHAEKEEEEESARTSIISTWPM